MTNTDFENLRAHAQRGDYTNAHLARRVQELEAALDAAQDDLGLMREAAHKRIAALEAEAAAARAWAAAWRTSAHVWRREMLVPRTLTFHANLGMVSAERRARRAAEAMEAKA